MHTDPPQRGPDRSTDRRLAFAGVVIAAAFLAAAAVSLALPPAARLGWWLPLHLVLAGAAGTAIAGMLPFFVAALAIAPPAPAWLHGGAIALVASGAALIGIGRAIDPGVPAILPVAGAVTFVAGAAAVAASAFLPLARATGPRRPASEAAAAAGLACLIVGGSLAGMFLAGVPDVIEAWPRLRAAHAWLNVLGFLTLVIAGTLLHLAPTVAGSRIRARRSGTLAVAALGAGVAAGAGGYLLANDLLVRIGVPLLVAGAASLAWHGVAAQRAAVGWTTDPEWHRFTAWSLLLAPMWLVVATVLVGARAFGAGAEGSGWRLEDAAAPLVMGFAVQTLLGAITHLVPAIGPGDPARRAAARAALGTLGSARVATWNVGTALLLAGSVGGVAPLATIGAAALGAAGVAALVALVVALGRR